jgi:hypothetical protein
MTILKIDGVVSVLAYVKHGRVNLNRVEFH